MYFKPRIFISSTFDLLPLRKKIDNILGETGAEVLLYEKNLTPSVDSYTYRKDIQDSDFIIFILDSRYGTKVNKTGLSGTHEEWKIAASYGIPCHVYINNESKKESGLEKLIEDLNKDGISYFYYTNESDLVKRLKSSIFTIANEIAYKNFLRSKFREKDAKKIIHGYEYTLALEFIKLVESAILINQIGQYSFEESTLMTEAFGYIDFKYHMNRSLFYDRYLDERFIQLMNAFNDFYNLHSKVTTSRIEPHREIKMKFIDGKLDVNRLEFHGTPEEREQISKKVIVILEKFSEFKEFITMRKIEIDLL